LRTIQFTYEDRVRGEITLDITYTMSPYKSISEYVEIIKISEDGVEVDSDESLLSFIEDYILENDEDDIYDDYYNEED
jgi:hypothetical protein